MSEPILKATNLSRHFKVGGSLFRKPKILRAVEDVSLTVQQGETLAIVGESGCGKSTLARMLMRLIEPTSGQMTFEGRQIDLAQGRALTELRRDMQFIFQDPFSSLNPRMTVGRLVGEPIETHAPQLSARERRAKVAELLAQVGLRPEHADRYPHEFSGGQRQRIGIARALASGPKLIIGDEPVSALDVSVQAQVINLLADLRDRLGLTLVVIAHDLAVIRHMSDRVAVMYLGSVVEEGGTDDIFARPRHPYTRALLSAIPVAEYGRTRQQIPLEGEMPSPLDPPSGCRFHTRCPFARDACKTEAPVLRATDTAPGHRAACHFFEEIAAENPPPPATEGSGRTDAARARFALYADAIAGTETRPRAET
ncbi:ABC transporter ATP-binding protein [Citreimonas salinaria]|uniref:Peptide/nickel transport system ATP-binding protein/oligopeptide transport system ATP-binding protein n=1 Tax=Citreimonas salinaria TaxID=321339 RepID=A0A1H3MMY7_9RHOB|nr:dipeptide ABC transporter ATP-binding protein [Citreimonas salinaria]SDY77545.1 peptide/nickel transport system ATP-binding protein/oligopeptide transport system ATP-binding protein [Citreimonas salinaria]